METATFDRVRAVIVQALDCAPDAVKPEAVLETDLSVDSLDRVVICMDLEEEYGLRSDIPEDTMWGWLTVGDVVATFDVASPGAAA